MVSHTLYLLVSLMTLAGYKHDVTPDGQHHGSPYGIGTAAYPYHLWNGISAQSGLSADTVPKMIRISGRADAIRAAVMLAVRGDIVLVAGKGHETYQEVKGVRHHFDDREELRKAFKMS